jgi:FdhD protein
VNRPEHSDPSVAAVRVCRISRAETAIETDHLAVEEPLEIRLGCMIDGKRAHRPISVTMRTPGQDGELAAGFLFAEGIINEPGQFEAIHRCRSRSAVRVDLRPNVAVDWARLERHSFTSASCGVCGKRTLESVRIGLPTRLDPNTPVIHAEVIQQLPSALAGAQPIFARTGGLHAAALFDSAGILLALREDVGRHNALDKLIGSEFLAGRVPLTERVLLLSGRASFELVQKAAMAGIPIVAAVGAPSSSAVNLAAECGMTLAGFVRPDRINVYTSEERILGLAQRISAAQMPRLNGDDHVQFADDEIGSTTV